MIEQYTQDILVTVDDGGRYIDVLNYDTPGDGTLLPELRC